MFVFEDGRKLQSAGLLPIRRTAPPPLARPASARMENLLSGRRNGKSRQAGSTISIRRGCRRFPHLAQGGRIRPQPHRASYVVLFDPWWNPAVENQAIDRTHRIGQVNKVIAYRLLIKDSVEEKFAQSLTLDDLKFLLTD